MSSLNHRRRRVFERINPPAIEVDYSIPAWSDLRSMSAPAVRLLAEQLGIEYMSRMPTLKAINAAR